MALRAHIDPFAGDWPRTELLGQGLVHDGEEAHDRERAAVASACLKQGT